MERLNQTYPPTQLRYAARWNGARDGYGVYDVAQGAWVPGYPVFRLERAASGTAEALNQADLAGEISRCLRELRRLAGQDRQAIMLPFLPHASAPAAQQLAA